MIHAPHYVEYMTQFSRGVTSSRLRLYPDEFLRMEMVIPPLDEQRTIADFLDTETARIDELSAKYELAEQLSTERWAARRDRPLAELRLFATRDRAAQASDGLPRLAAGPAEFRGATQPTGPVPLLRS